MAFGDSVVKAYLVEAYSNTFCNAAEYLHRPMDVVASFLPLSLTADRYHDPQTNGETKTEDRRG